MPELNEDNIVPLYYTVSPKLTVAQVAEVAHALSSTPIVKVIITDYHDSPLAGQIHRDVLYTTKEHMFDLAQRIGEPVVVVTGDTELEAHYPDGHTEVITLCDKVWSADNGGLGQQTIQDSYDCTYGGDRPLGIDR